MQIAFIDVIITLFMVKGKFQSGRLIKNIIFEAITLVFGGK